MVKKLEKGSNLASSNTQQKNHNSSNANTTKCKKHKSRMCYGCGLYGHEWALCPHKSWADKVEAADKKASTKLAKQSEDDGTNVKKLIHPTMHCPSSQESKKRALVATRKCYGCNEKGHMINKCPNKQNKSKANQGCICYACRRKEHLSYDCPNGKNPKPNTYGNVYMLRRATNGASASKVMCSPQTSTNAIWVPKHLLTNSQGPNKSWVPKYT